MACERLGQIEMQGGNMANSPRPPLWRRGAAASLRSTAAPKHHIAASPRVLAAPTFTVAAHCRGTFSTTALLDCRRARAAHNIFQPMFKIWAAAQAVFRLVYTLTPRHLPTLLAVSYAILKTLLTVRYSA
ncbi:hypothetical protein DFH06DRAFT_1325078 [Mycena polygramma]|nr:hypothetical protein DFH06DRAFT_1325078 [Mycena polygramma]